jgi:hypothetical protein
MLRVGFYPFIFSMKKIIILTLIIASSFTELIFAHPGNTASDGCHYCRTNCDKWWEVWNARHCHWWSTYTAPTYTAPTYVEPTKTPTEECQSSYGTNATYDYDASSCACKVWYQLSSTWKSCVKEKKLTCKSWYELSSTWKSCVKKKLTCSAWYVLSNTWKSCVKEKKLTCKTWYKLSSTVKSCVKKK